MIIDVHTHTPRFRDRASMPELPVNTKGRPDKVVATGYTWDDYLAVMEPVDRAICFNIATDPRPIMPGTPAATQRARPRHQR